MDQALIDSLVRQAKQEGQRAAECHRNRDSSGATWHHETLTRIKNAAPNDLRNTIQDAFNQGYRDEAIG